MKVPLLKYEKTRCRVQLVQVVHFGSLPATAAKFTETGTHPMNFVNFALAYRLSRAVGLWRRPC
jgi:hypothetical protein